MSIVSSAIVEDSVQKDGRRWVRERHLDQVGLEYVIAYLAQSADNATTIMNARATQLALDITAAEIAANVAQIMVAGSLASPTFIYSTMLQSRNALRLAYQNSTRIEAVMIGDFLSSLTDAQLQAAFSMTAGQVTTLRSNRLTPAAATASAIRAAAGQ